VEENVDSRKRKKKTQVRRFTPTPMKGGRPSMTLSHVLEYCVVSETSGNSLEVLNEWEER
jgi:hypothetical protein